MIITLYNYSKESYRINKSSYLEEITTLTGTLKQSCDIITPTFLIQTNKQLTITANDIDIVDSDDNDIVFSNSSYPEYFNLIKANFAYVKEFNRYYFITNITVVTADLFALQMMIDPLYTNSTQILNNYAWISRNQFDYNSYLSDDMIQFRYFPTITEYNVTNLSTVIELGEQTAALEENRIVYRVGIINDVSPQQAVIPAPNNVLPRVSTILNGLTNSNNYYWMKFSQLKSLLDYINEDDARASFVTSIVVYPFDGTPFISSALTPETIRFGSTDTPLSGYAEINSFNYLLLAHFAISPIYADFRDYQPYSIYELYIPYHGWITLDNIYIYGNELKVYASISDDSGNMQISLVSNNKLIFSTIALMGVSIPKNTVNNFELQTNRLRITAGLMTGLFGVNTSNLSNAGMNAEASTRANQSNKTILTQGLLGNSSGSGMSGLARGNMYAAAAQLGAQIGGSIVNSVASYLENRPRANAMPSSSLGGRNLPQDFRIRVSRMTAINYDSNYSLMFGKPLNAYRKLSTLSGLTQVSSIHLEIDNITLTEKQMIETALKSAVII